MVFSFISRISIGRVVGEGGERGEARENGEGDHGQVGAHGGESPFKSGDWEERERAHFQRAPRLAGISNAPNRRHFRLAYRFRQTRLGSAGQNYGVRAKRINWAMWAESPFLTPVPYAFLLHLPFCCACCVKSLHQSSEHF